VSVAKKSSNKRSKQGRQNRQSAPDGRKNAEGATKAKTGPGFYLVLAAVAIVGVGALWYAGIGDGGAPANPPLSVADMEAEASGAAGVSMGPDDAPVTIIEFEDYRCPSCRNFNARTGRPMRQSYSTGDDAILRWVAYDYPIFGQVSWPPALAARCAEDQGRFWEMHDLLYARTETWYGESNPNAAFVELAEVVGLDTGEFRTCLAERPHLKDIAASRKYGESVGVGATPTLYMNGRPLDLNRYGSYAALEQHILETAAQARPTEGASAGDAEEDGTAGDRE
jgi:protein-disulfide isomerase